MYFFLSNFDLIYFQKEKFINLKDSIIFEKNYSKFFRPCYSCKNLDHLFENCPFLHYIPNIKNIIQKHNFSIANTRADFFQRKKRLKSSTNSLKNLKNIQNSIINNPKIEDLEKIFLARLNTDFTGVSSINDDEDYDNVSSNLENEFESNRINDNFSYTLTSEKTKKENNKDNGDNGDNAPNLYGEINPKELFSLSNKNNEFEQRFLEKILEKQVLILKKKQRSDFLSLNLFNFEFDKPNEFKYYYPLYNFDFSIKNYKKYSKKKARLRKKIINENISKFGRKEKANSPFLKKIDDKI